MSVSVLQHLLNDADKQHKTDMSKFKTYIDETTNELFHKVSWPSWSELQSSAIIVAIASAIIALIVLVMDLTFEKAMEAIYHLF